MLVHGLVLNAVEADKLRNEISDDGASGLVSVSVWDGTSTLPYVEDLVDDLRIDAQALGSKSPSQAEIDRVLIPKFGVAHIHEKGAWREYRRRMPETYGEWTHYYNDATNNPVGSDRVAGVATGIRWIADGQATGEKSFQLVGNGRLMHFNVEARSNFSGYGGQQWAVSRAHNAFNGLPIWEQVHGNWKAEATPRYEGALIDGDRLIHLRTRTGPLVATSMKDGQELMTFPLTITPNAASVRIPATTSDGVNVMCVLEGRSLFVVNGSQLSALNADTGKLQWAFTAPAGAYMGFPCIDRKTGTLAVALGPLGMASGRQTHFRATEFRGFDAATGEQRWATPNPITDYIASMATLDGSVYVASAGHLGSLVLNVIGVDAMTGAVRWKQLDLPILASGTMMLYPGRGYIGRSALSAFDLSDGKLLGTFSTGNGRCDAPRGSALTINNFGHFFDVSNPDKVRWTRREIVRNSCGGAAIPAYGLRFASDNRCSCFEAVRGQVALSHLPVPPPTPDDQRLTKGPAYSRPLTGEMKGWTSFLGSDRRSGAGGSIKNDKPVKRWQVKVATAPSDGVIVGEWHRGDQWNGAITPPTVANGKVYVAETSGHRLVCLDGESGKELWSFFADARIDGPPRLTRGRAVFGSRDGSVYCLDAADGALAWRFQAAPNRQRVSAYGQLESPSPVYGAVPVIGDMVVASAGRHPEADGGIAVYGLNLATGAIAWKRTLGHDRDEITVAWSGGKLQTGMNKTNIFTANRVANNVIVADETVFALSSKRMKVADGTDVLEHPELYLMPSWNQIASPVRRPSQLNLSGPGGWGASWGLIDDNLMLYKPEKPGSTKLVMGTNKKGTVGGRPICQTEDVLLLQLYATENGGVEALVCYPRSAAKDGGPPLWRVESKDVRMGEHKSVAANSMIIAGDRIIMTTSAYKPGDRGPTNSPLTVRSLATGEILHSEILSVPSVDHGIAVADGRVYISLDDGSLLCME